MADQTKGIAPGLSVIGYGIWSALGPDGPSTIAGIRGQIIGSDARAGWDGWDEIHALVPAAEMQDLIIELRSATAGVGSFVQEFDHLAEIGGKLAEEIAGRYGRAGA